MTTCARRQEPDLVGDDQGQPASQPASQQASKQDPAAAAAAAAAKPGEHGFGGRSPVTCPGPLGGFCRLSATWKLLCTHPACHESTTSIHDLHCTFLTLPVTADSSHLHTSVHTNTRLCQQSETADKPSLSSYHTPARKLLAGACTTSTSFPASQCRSVPQLVTPILHQGYTLPQHYTTPHGNLPARSTSQHSHGLHAPPLFIAAWQSPPQRAAPPTASRLQGRRSVSHKSLQDRHC